MVLPALVTNAPVAKADLGSWRGHYGCCWEGQTIGMLKALADQTCAAVVIFDMGGNPSRTLRVTSSIRKL